MLKERRKTQYSDTSVEIQCPQQGGQTSLCCPHLRSFAPGRGEKQGLSCSRNQRCLPCLSLIPEPSTAGLAWGTLPQGFPSSHLHQLSPFDFCFFLCPAILAKKEGGWVLCRACNSQTGCNRPRSPSTTTLGKATQQTASLRRGCCQVRCQVWGSALPAQRSPPSRVI